MKHIFLSLSFCLLASAAHAECYADYKAKRDDPLRLHYGVAQIDGECSVQNAARQMLDRLGSDGWQLLNILGVFDETGLAERETSAGEYYLRY